MFDSFRLHPYVYVCAAVGVASHFLLPSMLPHVTRAIVAWDIAVAGYMAVLACFMHGTDVEGLRKRAVELDGGRALVLVVTLAAAAASIAAIVLELAAAKSRTGYGASLVALVGVTIALSWSFTHLMFALHYAHEYYAPDDGGPPSGLTFPGDAAPTYGDFVHFSYVIGCAAQTADIAIVSPELRRVVTLHCIAAFVFNTAIVALTINIAAGMLG